MKALLTLTRKDFQLLILDKTSLAVTFALPLVLIGLLGGAFTSMFPPGSSITSYDYIFSKVMFWGLIGGVASSVASIAAEKNSGTMLRLQVSPVKKFQILFGKAMACLIIMLVSSLCSWLLAKMVFGIKTNSYIFLALICITNAIFFIGIMTFLSNFVRTERAAGALSWSVLQVLACFSGIMFPTTVMPSWMKTISSVNPLTWAVKAMELALWEEITFTEMFLPMVIPVLTGIALFIASVYLFRWSAEK